MVLTGDKTGQIILDKAVETNPTGGECHARFGQSRQSRQDISYKEMAANDQLNRYIQVKTLNLLKE